MTDLAGNVVTPAVWFREQLLLGKRPRDYVRSLLTPANAVAAAILCIGLPVTINRFVYGLAASTNLTDDTPWGLWVGFDVLCGVALAAGGFVMASTVHVFGLRDYHPFVRLAVLTGFLGYFFVVVGLLYDLGRPYSLPLPLFLSPGVTSVKFEVAWCVALYLTVQFLEICPAFLEWLGWKSCRAWAVRLTVGATIFGVILSTLHQSALGGLFLMAAGKVHPLWYTPYIPVLFFVSAVAAGISMVIFIATLSYRLFSAQVTDHGRAETDRLILGLGKAGALVLFTYTALKWLALAHGQHWDLLATRYGAWWMLEVGGFVMLPAMLYALAVRRGSVILVRVASVLTILGLILNRLNIAVITYHWDRPDRYIPNWQEFAVTLTIVTLAALTFRWIVNRMPVLRDHPEFDPVH